MTNIYLDPITAVERLRRVRGWTARRLAEEAGTSPSVVSRIEAGHRHGGNVRKKVSRALGCTESDLWPVSTSAQRMEEEDVD